jgi:phosphate transport system permease protein
MALGLDRDSRGHPHHREHAELVPASLREAAYALGTPKWKVITMVTLRAARAGVITGYCWLWRALLGRPRLCCSLRSTTSSGHRSLSKPMASLPVTIFKFAMSPYENWQQLAWAGCS